jgi:uncharacterized protein
MKRFILSAIRFYKKYLSIKTGQICRFTPTCSEYTYQAINTYGIITGSWLGLKRIIRCNPWNKGGFDPIPQTL